MVLSSLIIQFLMLAVILVVSIWLHEYAHAYVSDRLGDPTPKLQRRLTPNPLAHIDLLGFVLIFIIWFWRGKPVIVNPSYYKKPLLGELMVALAGPATNLALASLSVVILWIYAVLSDSGKLIIIQNAWSIWYENLINALQLVGDYVIIFWILFCKININLAIFNLLPLPPLDGFRFVKILVPRIATYLQMYGNYFLIFLFIVLMVPGNPILVGLTWILSTVSGAVFSGLFFLLTQFI